MDPVRLELEIHFMMTFQFLFSKAVFCRDLVLVYITYKKVPCLRSLFISLSLLIEIIYMNALNPALCLGYLKCTSNYKPFSLAVYIEVNDLFSLSLSLSFSLPLPPFFSESPAFSWPWLISPYQQYALQLMIILIHVKLPQQFL